MELPKNIVQIGSPDKRYKVFVEDYVISYIKETNRSLYGGQAGVAFYGKKYAEDEVYYYFMYGAAEILGLEGRGQYLSEKEKEQIETNRLEFFEELELLAWCTLGGDMPDGFYLLEQGKGIWINGYASFFEKNENMLNFMLIMGKRENKREARENASIRLAEGGDIDHRIMERREKLSELRKNREYTGKAYTPKHDRYERNGSWKTVVTGVVIMLCVIGIAALSDEEKMENFQVVAGKIMASFGEQQLPDAEEEIKENIEIGTSSESITENVETKEGELAVTESETAEPPESEPKTAEQETVEPGTTDTESSESEPIQSEVEGTESEPVVSDEVEPDKTVSYIVQDGDMLLTICRNHYGTEERLQEICDLNQIDNPDDIKVGQTILLPE